jgi:hypothetical protein
MIYDYFIDFTYVKLSIFSRGDRNITKESGLLPKAFTDYPY